MSITNNNPTIDEVKQDLFRNQLINSNKVFYKKHIDALHAYLKPLAEKGILEVKLDSKTLSEIWNVPIDDLVIKYTGNGAILNNVFNYAVDKITGTSVERGYKHWVLSIIQVLCKLRVYNKNMICQFDQDIKDEDKDVVNYRKILSDYYMKHGIDEIKRIIELNNPLFNKFFTWDEINSILNIQNLHTNKYIQGFICSLVGLPFRTTKKGVMFSVVHFGYSKISASTPNYDDENYFYYDYFYNERRYQ